MASSLNDDEMYLTSDDSGSSGAESDASTVFEGEWHQPVPEATAWRPVEPGQDAVGSSEFRGMPGLNPGLSPPDNVESNVGYFLRLFLSDGLFQTLANWANAKAMQMTQEFDPDVDVLPAMLSNWRDCTAAEIRKLIGMHFYMGLNKKPELHQYWSTDAFYCVPYFQQQHALSRDRFKQLLSCLRFYDCRDELTADPLRKVRPFLKLLQQACSNTYRPGEELSADESLLLYKGKLLFKQYIPTKRARSGIKVYCLCESATGYLFNFLVHSTAAENGKFGEGLGCDQLSLSERIVAELCREVLHEGYRVFTDKWFTSTRLASFLLEHGTHLTGTVRPDRGVPAQLRQATVPVNDVIFMRRECVLLVKSSEKKESGIKTVYLLDTKEAAAKVERLRIGRGGKQAVVKKSRSAQTYSSCMGGVDLLDGTLQPYASGRKTTKWFHKLCLHMCLQMARNGWLLFRKCGGQKSFVQFLEASIRDLIELSGDSRKRPGATLHQQPAAGIGEHFPARIPSRDGQPRPAKRCRRCYSNGSPRRSIWYCERCPGAPGLCLDPCFQLWHSSN